jgi:AcrR family transcriptional regulator
LKEMSATKQKVFDAAVSLFNNNGFSGTSVREIAKKAGVNVSLISYYFGGKKGLLEQLMISFLEGYLEVIDQIFKNRDEMSAKDCLLEIVSSVLQYQAERYHLARLVHREITVDTFLIREVMTTYLAKEKFFIQTLLEEGIQNSEFNKLPISITTMQIKGMLTMPFLQPQYLTEVLNLNPQEKYFVEHYYKAIERWIEGDHFSRAK